MHIPDGLLSTRVWGTMDVVAIPAVGLLARRAQREFDHHKVPLMGVMGAFIFAAQMINFPVGVGTSGHLVGAALLAFTLGPAAASIVMTAILGIQALVFQDGGLVALGTNIFNMAVAGVWLGYLPFALLRGSNAGVFVGATVSLFAAALLALSELTVSGVHIPPVILAVQLGFFLISAIAEGAITLAVVQALEKMQPGILKGRVRSQSRGIRGTASRTLGIAALALAAAGVFVASTKPDGIVSLAQRTGVWSNVTTAFPTPFANYRLAVIDSMFAGPAWLSKSIAGLCGLLMVYGVCLVISRTLIDGRAGLKGEDA